MRAPFIGGFAYLNTSMHQKIGRDFRGLGKVLIEAKPQVGAPIRGVGKRCYVTVTMKDRSLGIEFYVENVIEEKPGDPAFGFTPEDLTLFRGVAIYDIDDEHGERRTYGDIIPFDDFVKKYIKDEKNRLLIVGCMSRLEEEAMVKEAFFDRINNIWKERDIHFQELYSKRLH